ncbi:unnamed protein product [marine sediment metagenome]|uniref:Uncharacterized protein n=1 Tax=marine sediment metagenome TaxID=412755 RepID=X1JPH8_9ZZZZ
MPVGYLQARKGVRLQGPVVAITALTVGTAQAIFEQSDYLPAIVGVRTFRIKRIKGLNQAGQDTLLHIGTALAPVLAPLLGDIIPPLWTFNGLNFDFVEADLPEVEVNTDLLAWVDAETVIVMVEVEELG